MHRAETPLGRPVLTLLGKPATVAVIHELATRAMAEHELERRLPALPRPRLAGCLQELCDWGAVRAQRSSALSGGRRVELAPRGAELLDLAANAARWEARAGFATRTLPGAIALRTLADRTCTELLLATAGSRGSILARRASRHTPTARRLARLTLAGLIERDADRGHAGRPRYRPSPAGRSLAGIAIHAMACERERLRLAPAPKSDLADLLRLIAPVVAVPADLDGLYELTGMDTASGAVILRARAGALRTLSRSPSPPDARASATPEQWLRELVQIGSPRPSPPGEAGLRPLLRALAHAVRPHHLAPGGRAPS